VKQYCRAYVLGDLRQFPAWDDVAGTDGTPLADDTIVYIWDDLTVVTNPVVPDSNVLWNTVNEEWAAFCRDNLRFEIPEDLVDG
jgi:hypothetical protein